MLALERLQLLLPNPLLQSQAEAASTKLPFAAIRKQLRLLIEESEGGSDLAPVDISYVYSGYAPLSVRLVQCVAQMNGVLASFGGTGESARGKGKGRVKGDDMHRMNAHPIVGWKGFEDVVSTIPGPTVDISQKGDTGITRGSSRTYIQFYWRALTRIRQCSLKNSLLPLSYSSWEVAPSQRLLQSVGWANEQAVCNSFLLSSFYLRLKI